MYKYSIQVLLLLLMKIGAHQSIADWIELAKYIVNYKHTTVTQRNFLQCLKPFRI